MAKTFAVAAVSVAANTTGFAAAQTGATFALALTAVTGAAGVANKVTVTNNSATNHSAKTLALVGTGPNGETQTETMAAPAGSTFVTSTKYWITLTSVTPSATIGADTFGIGWAAAAVSAWFYPIVEASYFSIGFGCALIAGSPTYEVQHSFGDGNVFSHATITAKTASSYGEYTAPISVMRLAFSVAGSVSLYAIQAST